MKAISVEGIGLRLFNTAKYEIEEGKSSFGDEKKLLRDMADEFKGVNSAMAAGFSDARAKLQKAKRERRI